MSVDAELPPWGATARKAFREVFTPLLGLCFLLNLIRAVTGWTPADVLPYVVPVVLVTVTIVGFVASGLVWLVAEFRTGLSATRDDPPS